MPDFKQNYLTERFVEEIVKLKTNGKIRSYSEVADKIGYAKTSLSDVLHRRRNITPEAIVKFCELYEINLDFAYHKYIRDEVALRELENRNRELSNATVLAGNEDEYKPVKRKESEFINIGHGQFIMLTPLVEEYAQAGYLSGYSDDEYVAELPKHPLIVSQLHKGKYLSFRVTGDSMHDGSNESISDGDIVTGREISKSLWNSRFHIHKFKDYIIVHREGILIKRIISHEVEKGIIICRSLNPNKEMYPDFELFLDDISQIMNIVNVTKTR